MFSIYFLVVFMTSIKILLLVLSVVCFLLLIIYRRVLVKKRLAAVAVVLLVSSILIPTKDEMITMLLLYRLDRYMESHVLNMFEAEAAANSAMEVDLMIRDIHSGILKDLDHNGER